jgi:hypothetical protein
VLDARQQETWGSGEAAHFAARAGHEVCWRMKGHFVAADVGRIEAAIDPEAAPEGADRDAGNGGDAIVAGESCRGIEFPLSSNEALSEVAYRRERERRYPPGLTVVP